MLRDEMTVHAKTWRRRWGHYRTIPWNTEQVEANLQLVLEGKQARPIAPLKGAPLQLPAPASRT